MGVQMMNGGIGSSGANPGNSDALYIGDLQWVRLSFASFCRLNIVLNHVVSSFIPIAFDFFFDSGQPMTICGKLH